MRLSFSSLALVSVSAFLVLIFTSCGTKEEIRPIYTAEAIKLNDAHIEYWSNIDATVVEPSLMRKVTRTIVGWIPIGGDLIELPMNLVNVVFPHLPSTSHPALPKDGEWNDPVLMSSLKSIRIGAGYIRITPEAERGKDYKPEMCYFTIRCIFEGDCKCEDPSFDDFLSEIRVYLQFKDLKRTQDHEAQRSKIDELGINKEKPQESEVFLAAADIASSYDAASRTMHFNVSDQDIRPYMDLYDRFEIKLVAVGKYPRYNVYIDGKLRIDLIMGLQ